MNYHPNRCKYDLKIKPYPPYVLDTPRISNYNLKTRPYPPYVLDTPKTCEYPHLLYVNKRPK